MTPVYHLGSEWVSVIYACMSLWHGRKRKSISESVNGIWMPPSPQNGHIPPPSGLPPCIRTERRTCTEPLKWKKKSRKNVRRNKLLLHLDMWFSHALGPSYSTSIRSTAVATHSTHWICMQRVMYALAWKSRTNYLIMARRKKMGFDLNAFRLHGIDWMNGILERFLRSRMGAWNRTGSNAPCMRSLCELMRDVTRFERIANASSHNVASHT